MKKWNVEKTRNQVNVDWLSLNFKNIDADLLLDCFCQAVNHNDVVVENFVYNERGIVTGYTRSYSYLDTPYIVVSFCEDRKEMGVNIQITGQGCKLIYIDDIKRFLNLVSEYTTDWKCNRLDLAYDDFDGIIPVKKMVQSTKKELSKDGFNYIVSRIKRDMITIYQNYFDGKTSYNLSYGKHRSARSFRLYDKKIEQKLTDEECPYWYRLEIELRSKGKSMNADIAFEKFITGQKTIFDLFYDELSTIVLYCEPLSDGCVVNVSSFWLSFLQQLTSHNKQYLQVLECQDNFQDVENTISRRNAPTVEKLFKSTFESFIKYVPFLSLLSTLQGGIDFLLELIKQFNDNCILKPRYLIFKDYFKNKYKDGCFSLVAVT